MQLISLYSNQESFRSVEFNLAGPSFIVARQKNPGTNDDGKTYNGVGKSLLVRIIHFCLGASENNYKSFCEQLTDWVFYLDFKVNVQQFTVKRRVSEPNKIFLNDEELSIRKFNEKLEALCFSIPDDIQYLSFRSLIPFFIRPNKESYNDCMKPSKIGRDYQSLLYNSFLIGLDVNLVEKKYKLRIEQERIKELEQNFKKDALLRDFFTGDRDVSLTMRNIEDDITKIENDLNAFQVAEDYHDIQIEADKIERELFGLNNEIMLIKNNIETIDSALNISSTMSSSDIETIYKEAQVLFPDAVKKTLQEIDLFYSALIENRIRRLSEQKNNLSLQAKEKSIKSSELSRKLNQSLEYLGKHQALDLFISLSQKISNLKSEKDDLLKYQTLQSEYKTQERQIDKELIDLSEITDKYLVHMEQGSVKIKDYFRILAKKFYPQSIAGLSINTNEGENQLAFNIEPKIESDASDGINNVKLFCYDLTLLFEGKNHCINFIFHDSRLYDGIDERQKTMMFKIIAEVFKKSQKQYIATINQNQLNEIKQNLSPDEYKAIIEENTVLTLTDDSDAEKLLGITVDIGND